MPLKLTHLKTLLLAVALPCAHAQQTAVTPSQATPAPIKRRDPTLDAAASEIGRALFLRCLCADDDLNYDLQGYFTAGEAKPVDWTLAGINVQKVERKSPNLIELDGVRVAIRFAADRHEFERHPQKDEAIRVTVADNGNPAALERTLHAAFAIGIDRALQKSMPAYWQHYFEPALPWPPNSADALTGQTIYNVGQAAPANPAATPSTNAGPLVTAPVATHKVDTDYTNYAARDHIKGSARVRMVVDAEGNPRRVSVATPLGYGLDEEAVKAASKMRFSPATLSGQPVAVNLVIDQPFALTPPPGSR